MPFDFKLNAFRSAGFSYEEARQIHNTLSHISTRNRIKIVNQLGDILSAFADQQYQPRRIKWNLKVPFQTGTLQIDPSTAAALVYYFQNDANVDVRRLLAQRIHDLKILPTGFLPIVAHQLIDPDPDIRNLGSSCLEHVDPTLGSVINNPLLTAQSSWSNRISQNREENLKILSESDLRLQNKDFISHAQGAVNFTAASAGRSRGNNPPDTKPLPPEHLIRYTELDYKPEPEKPAHGQLSFSLRIKSTSKRAKAVDIRVPDGQKFARVLISVHSREFKVEPRIQIIKVPRKADSEIAVFSISADSDDSKTIEGKVTLLVYDQYRLIGSLEVHLKTIRSGGNVELIRVGDEIFRDPAQSCPVIAYGITIQVQSYGDDYRKVGFDLIHPNEDDDGPFPDITPFDFSPNQFDPKVLQNTLNEIRADVEIIQKNFDNPEYLGADSLAEVKEGFLMRLTGAGNQIARRLLPENLYALLVSREKGSVINWVLGDEFVHAIPWELISDPLTELPLNADRVFVRVPAFSRTNNCSSYQFTQNKTAEGQVKEQKLVYLVGKGVSSTDSGELWKEAKKSFSSVLSTIEDKFKIITNFNEQKRDPLNLIKFRELVEDGQIVMLLCHGVIKESGGYYLKLEDNVFGRISSSDISTLNLRPGTLVFVNACSSASATFSPAGLTTIGEEFINAGASCFIGTLAPVSTKLALRFAQTFMDVLINQSLSVPQAMIKCRQEFIDEQDPSWLFYTIYGDSTVPI